MHRKKNEPQIDKRIHDNKPKFGKPQSNYEKKMK